MTKTEIVRAIQATHWPDNDDEKVTALIQALEDAGMEIRKRPEPEKSGPRIDWSKQ